MIVLLDLVDDAVAGQLVALQRAAYAIEAELIGSNAIPGLSETIEDVRRASETFVGIYDETELIAALSYEVTLEVLDLCRLVVAPASARRGLGERLVRWALEAELRPVTIVSTGSANAPAVALYAKLGFTVVGEEEVVPGLVVTRFELRR